MNQGEGERIIKKFKKFHIRYQLMAMGAFCKWTCLSGIGKEVNFGTQLYSAVSLSDLKTWKDANLCSFYIFGGSFFFSYKGDFTYS